MRGAASANRGDHAAFGQRHACCLRRCHCLRLPLPRPRLIFNRGNRGIARSFPRSEPEATPTSSVLRQRQARPRGGARGRCLLALRHCVPRWSNTSASATLPTWLRRPPAAHGSALAKSRCDCTARQRPFPAQPAPAESRAGTTHARKPSPYFGRAGTLRTMRSGCRPRKDSAAYPPAWWALCAVAAHSLRAAAWPRAVAPPRSPPLRRGRPGCPGTRTHHPMRRWLDERLPVSTTRVVAPP